MRYQEELIERLAQHRRAQLGNLSEHAYEELVLAVRRDPQAFLVDDSDRAYERLGKALAANELSQAEEEFLDDAAYEASRKRRLLKLREGCAAALAMSDECLDARTIQVVLENENPDAALVALEALAHEEGLLGGGSSNEAADADGTNGAPNSMAAKDGLADAAANSDGVGPVEEDEALANTTAGGSEPTTGAPCPGNAWDDVFARPRLRLLSAIARARLETARYKAAIATCEKLVELDSLDHLGARYTWAVALARLEDEKGLDALDAKFGRAGNAWIHLARTLLMFKLDRMPAARRALRGYASLCEGGAYALLRPTFIDGYLPDRPVFTAGSFEEAALAVHECDAVVMDTPDFIAWATAQDGFAAQAEKFARDHDLDW